MLRRLVAANLITSGAHFLHNAVFLDAYPGPPWITGPWFVVVAWCVVASVLVQGYRWHRDGRGGRALAAILAFSASCFFVFGHYLYGPPADFDLITNALIFAEGIGGAALLVYYLGWGRLTAGRRP